MKLKTRTTLLLAGFTGMLMLSGPAFATSGKGMTWLAYDLAHSSNASQAAAWQALLAVEPDAVVVGCANKCDAYKGDTAGSERLPILCFVPGTKPEPALYAPVFAPFGTAASAASSNWRFYYGWSKGKVGLTRPVLGSSLTSRAVGDAMCKTDLKDPAARMAEHHDNGVGGWALGATIHPNSNAKGLLRNPQSNGKIQRFWTAINDQPANPWNP